jgi:hypothetical protein
MLIKRAVRFNRNTFYLDWNYAFIANDGSHDERGNWTDHHMRMRN